ncbi:MAG: HDOD domain-containing protein [Gammaproteobacteria bacterium]|nr:HDOD domain-containing protein [Gammaproteobacteria bacterium]
MSTSQATFAFVQTLAAELSHQEFDIPPFPDIAIRIRDAMDNPNVTTHDIAKIITADPVLTSRLLRMANSALLRRGSIEITDINVAIGRLGYELVRNTVISLAMDTTFNTQDANDVIREYMHAISKHSTHVGALAYILARQQPGIDKPEDAMLAGLLHDIGKFYILTRANDFPELFGEPEQLEELLATWHTGVGRAIIESWGFPEHIAMAADEHEALDRNQHEDIDIADLVLVANLFVNLYEKKPDELPDLSEVHACTKMDLTHLRMADIMIESEEEIVSIEEALGG